MITIIDYGLGNINAFINVYKRVNVPVNIARSKADLLHADKLILPGVGNFDYAMNQLNKSGMREILDKKVLEERIPVMGICVGMQMMANRSEEGKMDGLKWLDATVRKFDESTINHATKIPHMGWNDVVPIINNKLFKGLEKDAIFYFLHTYYFLCNQDSNIIAVTDYGIKFASAVQHDNIYGIQFHPEKSHAYGETLLHNFAKF